MTRGETDIPVVVTGRRRLAPTIDEFTLAAAHGGALPAFEAGAHIDVETPGGHRRSYSLCAPTAARPRAYTIAVDRRADGEGGSVSMHDRAATVRTLLRELLDDLRNVLGVSHGRWRNRWCWARSGRCIAADTRRWVAACDVRDDTAAREAIKPTVAERQKLCFIDNIRCGTDPRGKQVHERLCVLP